MRINRIAVAASIWAIITCFSSIGLYAASSGSTPEVAEMETGRDGSRFFFNMTVNPKEIDRAVNNRVELVPVIVSADSAYSVELPPVTVAGRNMYYSTLRNGTPDQVSHLYRAGSDSPVEYKKWVDYQDWMENCSVDIRTRYTGCCGQSLDLEKIIPVAKIDMRKREYNADFVYVAPVDTAEKRFNLSGRANVRFIVNRTNIDWSYANNYVELDSILRTVNAVKNNPDATVESIWLTGYASPEGPYDNNVRLSIGRTEVIKEYVRNNASFPASVYHTSSVPEDWEGLREWLVGCEFANRDEMIAFVDDESIPAPKKNDEFMKRFPKEYPFILANVYPPLRHTNYRITYLVRKYMTIEEIREVFKTRPANLSLDELYKLANSYQPGSDDYDEVFDVAVRLYPDDATANLNAANSAMHRGRFDQASKYLDRAGTGPQVDHGRGVLLAMQGKYSEAIPHLRKAAEGGIEQAGTALEEIEKVADAKPGIYYINREIEDLKAK